jgi:hypothetical protein
MAGQMDANTEFLIRSQLWSRQIKELLLDELNAMKFVRIISDFPDGYLINIPSIGEAETADFTEGQAIKYNSLDTGNFTFQFDQYKYSAHSISEKFKRDSYYSSDVIAAFVPREHRALMEAVETRILAMANAGQTAASTNVINLADHRWVGSGSGGAIAFQDFARAHYALTKANVPLVNLVAIVDPSVAYTMQTQTNVVNLLSPMPMWESVIKEGAVTGFKFRFNLYGFDIYVSNYLPNIASESITSGGVAGTVTNGVANYFFSAAPGDTLPWVGAFRQMPTVYSEFNKDLQQEEYLTIAEYGFKLYRPENMVTVLTNTTVVPT